MTTFITQARFTKDGLNGIIAAPEDRGEIVGGLIAQVGGKLIANYLTSGEYDILIIFEGASYEDMVLSPYCCGRGERRCRLEDGDGVNVE